MKITYDPGVDALYISFLEGQEVTTKRLTSDIAIDYGVGEHVAGIEILEASKQMGELKNIFGKIDVDKALLAG
jgi:uncharacterized protein YuzE